MLICKYEKNNVFIEFVYDLIQYIIQSEDTNHKLDYKSRENLIKENFLTD